MKKAVRALGPKEGAWLAEAGRRSRVCGPGEAHSQEVPARVHCSGTLEACQAVLHFCRFWKHPEHRASSPNKQGDSSAGQLAMTSSLCLPEQLLSHLHPSPSLRTCPGQACHVTPSPWAFLSNSTGGGSCTEAFWRHSVLVSPRLALNQPVRLTRDAFLSPCPGSWARSVGYLQEAPEGVRKAMAMAYKQVAIPPSQRTALGSCSK